MSVNIWLERLAGERVSDRGDAPWQDELHYCIDKFETATLMAMHDMQAAGLLSEALDLGFLEGEELNPSEMLMGPEQIEIVRGRLGPLTEWFASTFDEIFDVDQFQAACPMWDFWHDTVIPGTGAHLAQVMSGYDAFLAEAMNDDQVVVASYG